MEFLASAASDELCITRAQRRQLCDEDSGFKSKNLFAERRRRQKLSDRLLALRALVPIITNMNKATIVEDAITYIHELQGTVKALSDELLQMELSIEEEEETENPMSYEIDGAEEMKKNGIEEEVKVSKIDGNKLLVKIIFEKKRGNFTKLMEAINCLGLELTDVNVTTAKGAFLVSSSIQGIYGDAIEVDETQKLLLEIIRGI